MNVYLSHQYTCTIVAQNRRRRPRQWRSYLYLYSPMNFCCALYQLLLFVGLDLADIECVVHSSVPNTVTDYVQEIGRASHEPSKYGYTILLTHNGMGVGRPIEQTMRDFYKTSNCRRKTLMADFRIQPGRTEICCDSCVWDLSTSCPLCAYIQTDTNQGPHDKVRDRGEQLCCTHNQSC